MAKDDLYFRLRLPEDIKQRVQEAAEASHRSMTAEIIARLENSFSNDPSAEVLHAMGERTGILLSVLDHFGVELPSKLRADLEKEASNEAD